MEEAGEKKWNALSVIILGLSFTGFAFAMTPQEKLGKALYADVAFSVGGNQSCQTCHHPSAGFADPVNRRTLTPVSAGSDGVSFGGRNAPPAAYAVFSPPFSWNETDQLFIGGLFWDGRATGRLDISGTQDIGGGATADTLADQAKGPFLNPVEMALADEQAVIDIFMANPNYVKLYNQSYGNIASHALGTKYNNIAMAISAFEKFDVLNKFTSKFDAFRAEQAKKGQDVSVIVANTPVVSAIYTADEIQGLVLFNTVPALGVVGGGCALCHPVPFTGATLAESVFTDFSYDNLGIPKNPTIASLAGDQATDYGLGAQVAILEIVRGVGTLPTINDERKVVTSEAGKFKVSSLRNVAKTAPYGHNGFFVTLLDIVHFYNTRDVPGEGWAPPEVLANMNDSELGKLGLTPLQEEQIVAFLETLTDGYIVR